MGSPADKWFQGLIDEVAIYNRALSPAEIRLVMRQETAVLPTNTTLNVASGATVDLSGAEQRVAALTGAGKVELGAGVLTVAGGTCQFDGVLSGEGDLAVCGGASLTLAGTNSFSGSVAVSNATLLISGLSTGGVDIVVRGGGRLGGSGLITGNVVVEDGAGLAAGSTDRALSVHGTVTPGVSGTVTLPEGSIGGRYPLISAGTLSTPAGLAGWSVAPVPEHWTTTFKVSDGLLTLNVFKGGTVIAVW